MTKLTIQGTDLDRRRKYSNSDRKIMRDMYKAGVSIKEISESMGINAWSVKYIVDDEYRAKDAIRLANAYKRAGYKNEKVLDENGNLVCEKTLSKRRTNEYKKQLMAVKMANI